MKLKIIIITVVLFFCSAAAVRAQNGGKAEPNRIEFAKGKTSAVERGVLRNDEEMDFVFSARASQIVTVKISSIPKGEYTAFVLFGDGIDLKTPRELNYDFTFKAPETGDYLLTVKRPRNSKVPKAKFILTLSIK